MDKSYADLLKENDLLKGTVQKLQETIGRLESEVKRLNNELRKYKNENTPSSANKHLKGNTQGRRAKAAKEARLSVMNIGIISVIGDIYTRRKCISLYI